MADTKHLRWGILSTGSIAGSFAGDLPKSRTGRLVAVGSRSAESAEAFAGEHGRVRAHGSYADLLADAEVDAVYIATPHPQHAEWAIRAARAGKHVLCEKPMCLNHGDAAAVAHAAAKAGVVLMEAFMYRCHPLTKAVWDAVAGGEIGEVQLIEASFAFRAGDDPSSRLLDPALGGGGILDVGCYAMSAARLVAGAARGEPFADPKELRAVGRIGRTGVDEWATATLDFGNGVLANLVTGVRLSHPRPQLRVTGTGGVLVCPEVFIPGRKGGLDKPPFYEIHKKGEVERREVPDGRPLYAIEADAFAEAVRAGEVRPPLMTPADTLGNMAALDRWRRAIDVVYPAETAEGYRKMTISGDPVRRGETIPATRIDGLDKPVSRLVMGGDNQPGLADGGPLWDAYFAAGGNAFDTAHVYGRDKSRAIGQWITARGVRGDVALICKGAHTPLCHPPTIGRQLRDQLDWLGTDHCDLYFMHRDNTDVPVGEFVDAMAELADAGLIRGVFGGSNWSLDRVKAASEYAANNGRPGFGAVSQQLSLAELVEPMWPGCLSARGDDWQTWLAETGTPNFAWSSQARGFFVPERDLSEPELKRCWVSDANLARRDRAFELAEQKGASPINIAAAWVLARPFPSFALIGPRTIGELESSLGALDVELTEDELAWLDAGG